MSRRRDDEVVGAMDSAGFKAQKNRREVSLLPSIDLDEKHNF